MPTPLLSKLSLFHMENENLTDEEFRELRKEFVRLRQSLLDRMGELNAELEEIRSALGISSGGQSPGPVPSQVVLQASRMESSGAP